MVTRTVTTTYASSAARSTAAPPTRIAPPRRRGGTGAARACSTVSDGRTDRHRLVDVGEVDGDDPGPAGGAGHAEDGPDQALVRLVEPQLAGDARRDPRDD